MKHTRNRLLALALALTMALSTLATGTLAVQTAQPADTAVTTMAVKTSGKCGKNVKWSYDKKTKTVTISGKGAMYHYNGTTTQGRNGSAPPCRWPCWGRSMATTCQPLGLAIWANRSPSSLLPDWPWRKRQTRSLFSP